jgi:hypothetical protein
MTTITAVGDSWLSAIHCKMVVVWQHDPAVLDLDSGEAYTAVTPANDGFMRLTARIEVRSK